MMPDIQVVKLIAFKSKISMHYKEVDVFIQYVLSAFAGAFQMSVLTHDSTKN